MRARRSTPGSAQRKCASRRRLRRTEFVHIFGVRRHDVDAAVDGGRDIAEELFDLRVAFDRDQRVVTPRHDALAEKNLDPTFLPEQIPVLTEAATVRAP